jgi:hexosaminidase
MQKEGEKATYGGFYTQDEIKEIVQYAADRFITIVPEIEILGHTKAALAAYPQFSCTGIPITVPPGGYLPLTDIFCAGNDSTFVFLQDVLEEVIKLFPGKYIHIGGDDVNKLEWQNCVKCQTRMKTEGLRNEEELQNYFFKRIEKFLVSKNHRLIGWDEVLKEGLTSEYILMLKKEKADAAARQGHDVIMTPTQFCSFDYYQGNAALELPAVKEYLPLSKVYSFEPVPDNLTADEAKHILGAQANVWTEYISTPWQVQYMTLPRMAAMAEVVWSQKEARNWYDFTTRVENLMKHYEVMKWNYAKSVYQVLFTTTWDSVNRNDIVNMECEMASSSIHYTLDGNQSTVSSPVYTTPISISKSCVIKAGAFKDENLIGAITEQKYILHKASFKSVKVKHPFGKFTGGGDYALTNTAIGTKCYLDGNWQGFQQNDLDAVIDLGETTPIKKITTEFLQNTNSSIFLPLQVEFAVSDNDLNYIVVGRFSNPIPRSHQVVSIKECKQELVNGKARYIRIRAKNIGLCPEWHLYKEQPAWLFVDEIIVE